MLLIKTLNVINAKKIKDDIYLLVITSHLFFKNISISEVIIKKHLKKNSRAIRKIGF